LAKGNREIRLFALIVPLIAVLLFLLNWKTASGYFLVALKLYIFPQGQMSLSALCSVIGTDLADLFFVSLPESVVPNFKYLFFPNFKPGSTAFLLGEINAQVVFGVIAGGAVSTVIAVGARRLWKAQNFALLALLLSLPVFALIADQTSRYLISYQSVLWCCFMAAAIPLAQRIIWNRRAVFAGALLVAVTAFLFQLHYVTSISRRLGSLGGITGVLHNFDDVAEVYGGVYGYLDGQPRDRSLVIYVHNQQYTSTVWTAVSGVDVYKIGAARGGWDAGKRVFLVLVCRTRWCGGMPSLKQEVQAQLGGKCAVLEPRARWKNAAASAEIFEFRRNRACSTAAL
jgi:hypothetical protein